MTVLLVAEHDNATLKDATAKALTAAKQIGGDVHVLVAGHDCRAAADAAAGLDGVDKVLVADDAAYANQLAEPMAALIVPLMENYDALLAAATTTGKNFMPRVAALLDVMQISDIISVESADTFTRPIYAGNAIQSVQSSEPKKVVTVRTAGFQSGPAGDHGPAGSSPPSCQSISKKEPPVSFGCSCMPRWWVDSSGMATRMPSSATRCLRGSSSSHCVMTM